MQTPKEGQGSSLYTFVVTAVAPYAACVTTIVLSSLSLTNLNEMRLEDMPQRHYGGEFKNFSFARTKKEAYNREGRMLSCWRSGTIENHHCIVVHTQPLTVCCPDPQFFKRKQVQKILDMLLNGTECINACWAYLIRSGSMRS